MKIKYVADDGTQFDTEKECVVHEDKSELIEHIKNNITTSYSVVFDANVIQYEDVAEYIVNHVLSTLGNPVISSYSERPISSAKPIFKPTIIDPNLIGIRDKQKDLFAVEDLNNI